MVHYIITNETVLIKQYASDRDPGWGVRGAKPPEAETLLAFRCSMEGTNLPAF